MKNTEVSCNTYNNNEIIECISKNNISFDEFFDKKDNTVDKINKSIESLDMYIEYIKLFMHKNGNMIKGMYSIIKENSLPYNKVEIVDVNYLNEKFTEYNNGMYQFIFSIIKNILYNNQEDSRYDDIVTNIDKAYNLDSTFIEKETKIDTVDLATSLMTFESIIDIKSFLEDKKENFTQIRNLINNETYKNLSDNLKSIIDRCISLYAKAINKYALSVILSDIDIYGRIVDSMCKRTSVKGESVIPEYVLL